MIKPTVGRVVWFHPYADAIAQPQAAIIAYVHSDRMVNLAVFDVNGFSTGKTSVPLKQEGDDQPTGMYAEWMPYQIGQAKPVVATSTD